MITEKQKCIAEQAVYGDLRVAGENKPIVIFNAQFCGINEYKPILRHISELTKEITHKGYNDDKPFVPLVEMESHFDKSMYEDDLDNGIEPYLALEYATYTGHHFAISDLLHLWHFDTRTLIEKGEAIDVNTLSINPYSV